MCISNLIFLISIKLPWYFQVKIPWVFLLYRHWKCFSPLGPRTFLLCFLWEVTVAEFICIFKDMFFFSPVPYYCIFKLKSSYSRLFTLKGFFGPVKESNKPRSSMFILNDSKHWLCTCKLIFFLVLCAGMSLKATWAFSHEPIEAKGFWSFHQTGCMVGETRLHGLILPDKKVLLFIDISLQFVSFI